MEEVRKSYTGIRVRQMWLSMQTWNLTSILVSPHESTLSKMNYSDTFQESGSTSQNVSKEHLTETHNTPRNSADQLKLWVEKINGTVQPHYFSNTS